MDYFEHINTIEGVLYELTGEQVCGLFTKYHGYQLFDEGFYQHLVDEGIIEDEDEDEDDDDDDDDDDDWEVI